MISSEAANSRQLGCAFITRDLQRSDLLPCVSGAFPHHVDRRDSDVCPGARALAFEDSVEHAHVEDGVVHPEIGFPLA